MRVGIAGDHGGFDLKEELIAELCVAGYGVVDFGAHELDLDDDYPDFLIPLARAVASGQVERGVAVCSGGIGASICANKIPGVRAGAAGDHFSAWQGVEDNHMNILCLDSRTIGKSIAWDLVQTFLAAKFSQAEPHLRRLAKLAHLEMESDETDKRQRTR